MVIKNKDLIDALTILSQGQLNPTGNPFFAGMPGNKEHEDKIFREKMDNIHLTALEPEKKLETTASIDKKSPIPLLPIGKLNIETVICYLGPENVLVEKKVLINSLIPVRNNFFLEGKDMEQGTSKIINSTDIKWIRFKDTGAVYEEKNQFLIAIYELSKIQSVMPQKEKDVQIKEHKESTERENQSISVSENKTEEVSIFIPPIPDKLKSIMGPLLDEIIVLKFLAAQDGRASVKELQKMMSYVEMKCINMVVPTIELQFFISELKPNISQFSESLQKIMAKDVSVVKNLMQGVLQVIKADGVIHENERLFFLKLLQILKNEGLELGYTDRDLFV